MWTLAFGHHPHAHTRLCGDVRGRHDSICQELAAGVTGKSERLIGAPVAAVTPRPS
jgi:hypothetical protein